VLILITRRMALLFPMLWGDLMMIAQKNTRTRAFFARKKKTKRKIAKENAAAVVCRAR
tara:strand:- start:285 stop:458 length:174 start_codon:yes stop_codon:yes gene_type:complete